VCRSKIKRIIFSTVKKWTGAKEETLSTPQIKQIAGRAGRYGIHGTNEPGIATTLHPADLPIVKKALEAPIKPLLCAGLPGREIILDRLFTVLPTKSTTLSFIINTFKHLCRFNPPYFLPSNETHPLATTVLDYHSRDLTPGDLLTWFLAPVQWRDETTAQLVTSLIQMHRHDMTVSLSKALSAFGLQDELDHVSRCIEIPVDQDPWGQLEDPKKTMERLETIHRAVVIYLWMNMRNPVIFPEYAKAHEVKAQTEVSMHFVLQALTPKTDGTGHSLLPPSGRREAAIKYDGLEALLKRRAGAK
jgi:ATP-dependent RNA helicase SUPV3L1/SUV3